MGNYTETLDNWAEILDPLDDDYEDSLREVASQFRGFNDALTSFISMHGYEGNPRSIEGKTAFMKKKFKDAGIRPIPRNIDRWFLTDIKLSRQTAFQICFALGLDEVETNDFFKRVQFERSFDCHIVNEAVYYYCMKNNKTYCDAQDIISKVTVINKQKSLPDGEILYTDVITRNIADFNNETQLISYINANAESFGYHNAKAITYIRNLWDGIQGSGGLAEKEGKIINKKLNPLHPDMGKKKNDTRDKEVIASAIKREEELSKDDYIVSSSDASVDTIFSQILGLDKYQEDKFSKGRGLKSIFSENVLLPFRAKDCFPDRQIIGKILRGECDKQEYEPYRKTLILLKFYDYWARKVINGKDVFYNVDCHDASRFLSSLNQYLYDAGYDELYSGNPYDWIFLWALNDDYPLMTFRGYILEIFDAEQKKDL